MQAGLVGHRKHPDVARMVRQCRIEFPLRFSQRRIEHRIEGRAEDFVATNQLNQIADVVLHVPAVYISVVFIIIIARTEATIVTVVHRRNKFSLLILRVEEARIQVEDIAIVVGTLQVMLGFIVLAQFFRDLREAPLVVRCPQRYGNRLALFPLRNIRHGFLFARTQSGDIAMLLVEIIEPSGRLRRPRNQGLFFNTRLANIVSLRQVEGAQALTVSINDGCNPVVAIHAARIAGNLREGRHPARSHLLGHEDEGIEDISFLLLLDQDAQRVCCPVGIPQPVVGIEGATAVFVYLPVESTVIASVFAQADRTFVGAIKRSIKYRTLVLGTAFDSYLPESLVPNRPSGLGDGGDAIVFDFARQILLCLRLVNQRDAITDAYLPYSADIAQDNGGILAFSSLLRVVHGRGSQYARLFRGLVQLYVEIDFRFVINILEALHRIAFDFQRTLAAVKDKMRRFVLLKLEAVNGALVRRGEIDVYLCLVEIDLITVRGYLFQIIAQRCDGPERFRIALERREVECRAFAVIRYDDGQSVQPVARKIGPLGIDTHQTVG